MDRLKEVKKGSKELIIEWLDNLLEWKDINEGIYIALRGLLNSSLAESYNLGRDEVIGEIGNALFEIRSGNNFCDAETVYEHIQNKLTSLKENKK